MQKVCSTNPKTRFYQKSSIQFSAFMALQLHVKTQKNSMHQFVLKLILSSGTKTTVQDFWRKSLQSILDLYASVTLCKKTEKIHAMIFKKT